MYRPLVKICGNTRIDDAKLSLECGADMLGFIFYEKSSRYISPKKAGTIIDKLKNNFSFMSVGVLVNPSKEYVDKILKIADLDMLQFHGEEPLSFIKNFRKKTIKAFRIKDKLDILKCDAYESVDYFLLDAFSTDAYGGTGKVFKWGLLNDFKFQDRLILAGGIGSNNIKEVVIKVKPYAVDLVSSLEKRSGIKDREKIKDFFSILNNELH
ncbi:MAG: phosphoribosylanthranilate isomerase [Spirochaetes bacterium]|nr:phosphoribosylanthranilate isomerase [Spirochaetota bacterium]